MPVILMMASMTPRSASVCRAADDIPLELPAYVQEELSDCRFYGVGGFCGGLLSEAVCGFRTCARPGMLFARRPDADAPEWARDEFDNMICIMGNMTSLGTERVKKAAQWTEEWSRLGTTGDNLLVLGPVARWLAVCVRHELYINKYLYTGGEQNTASHMAHAF